MNRVTGRVASVTVWASEDDEQRSRTAQEVHEATLEIVHLRQASW